jgi:hypothetical protein
MLVCFEYVGCNTLPRKDSNDEKHQQRTCLYSLACLLAEIFRTVAAFDFRSQIRAHYLKRNAHIPCVTLDKVKENASRWDLRSVYMSYMFGIC